MESKIERLERVLSLINSYEDNERGFNKLHEELKTEYQLEGGDDTSYVKGDYRHHLEQVLEDANNYLKAKTTTDLKNKYKDFTKSFKQDIKTELTFQKMMSNPSSGNKKI